MHNFVHVPLLSLSHTAEVQVKFFTLPSGALDELFDKEEEEDDNDEGDVDQEGEEEEEQEELDAYGNPKQSADSSFPR